MKNYKLIIATTILFAGLFINANAQYNISTNKVIVSVFNESSNSWDKVSENIDYSFFKINKNFTMVEHTTESLTSAYMVESSEVDDVKNQINFQVTSDVGNKYKLQVRIDKEDIIFYIRKNGKLYAKQFLIKQYWSENV